MRHQEPNNKRTSILARAANAALLAAALCASASAQSKSLLPPPAYATSPPVEGKVVVEEQYPYTVRRYSPEVEVKPLSRDRASYETPEAAAVAGISAMFAKDFEWFRSTWDRASNALMDERDKSLKRGPEFWTAAWEKGLKNKKAVLTQRVETGSYVLIVYKLVGEAGGAADASGREAELVTVLKLQDGKWLATQELSQDPVLLYWKTPDVKLKREMRGGAQDRIVLQP